MLPRDLEPEDQIALAHALRHLVNSLALNDELRAMLRQEQDWLTRAQQAVSEVRSFREQDMLRFLARRDAPVDSRRDPCFGVRSARRRGLCVVD